ncbi:MAG: M23 family metallopeptidase [Bacteroidia bacterium]|nr:M23 family metallopeptidase [Bacteroidia bacterium]
MNPFYFVVLLFGMIQCTPKEKNVPREKPVSLQSDSSAEATTHPEKTASPARPKSTAHPCTEFNLLNTQIRDGLTDAKTAQARIKTLIPEIEAYYYENGGKNYPSDTWIFPLKGYNKSAIGGTNGSGYVPSGYNYFDGNKHKGHPAHDIFIRDKNQDNLDDLTLEPVSVLSLSGGIVVAAEHEWNTESLLRGGIYVWIYDPSCKSLFYYAHNEMLLVSVGELVSPGQTIAHTGRTGLNAFKQRSPTHLHLTQLVIGEDGYPKSKDIYPDLIKMKTL